MGITSEVRNEAESLVSGTILVIDDSPELLLSIGATLETTYDVHVATSGEAGLKLAKELHPSLILLDIIMPGLNGFETCRRLRQNEDTRDIPVIFLTSKDNQDDAVRSFEVGGVDFITKPFSPVVLRARVDTHVRLKKQADTLNYLAIRDSLTGLFNRREFDDRFERECRACLRAHKPLSVMMIDIDYFKHYNDSYGHQKGDNCLQAVADTISKQLQRGRDLVARYGGEEFACLLPEADSDSARVVAEKIRAAVVALAIPHQMSQVSDTVTISIGIASTHNCEGRRQELLQQADASLYRAKNTGRNRVAYLLEQ